MWRSERRTSGVGAGGGLRGGIAYALVLGCLIASGGTAGAAGMTAGATGAPTGIGQIGGRIYTAESADSVAAGAEVTLVYRDRRGEVRHIEQTAGADGAFRFSGLAADTALAYVIKVDHRGNTFLGTPLHFAPDRTSLDFDILVGPAARPDVAGQPPAPSAEALPEGHPPVGEDVPALGRPVPVRPGLTLLLTGGIAGFFGLPVYVLSRRDRRREAERRGAC